MNGKSAKLIVIALAIIMLLGLAPSFTIVRSATVSADVDSWSRMDLPSTLNYQMFPDSIIWDLSAGDDGTLFALVEDTTGQDNGCMAGGPYNGLWSWDGLRWAVFPSYSDIAVFKSIDGGYNWELAWHVPASETGAPIAIVPQPGYTDSLGSKDTVFLAMGTRYLYGSSLMLSSYAGDLGEGNIYRSDNGGDSFSRITPRCPAVTLNHSGYNTGGTITSLDVVQNAGTQGSCMAIVGVSSLHMSGGSANTSYGEGVYTWNKNNTGTWQDLQICNALPGLGTPAAPGTMPAGNGLDVIQVMGSRNFATDGLIVAVANDFLNGDPANLANPSMVTPGVYVCFYDANDGSWGGDMDSPTNANPISADYAGAACMATGTDFNSAGNCNVFVGLAGCTVNFNNDVWRIGGLATVTSPSMSSPCGVAFNAIRISDIMIPAAANAAIYVGGEAPAGQAQVLCLTGGLAWPSVVPSFKPPSGAWPVSVANMDGMVMAAGGGDGATTGGVHKMVQTSSGMIFNGVGILDDIAVSEDIPGYTSPYADTWCLVEAVSEEVSPLFASDGLIYVSTMSDWCDGLSLWRLTSGKWERIMYEGLILPGGSGFAGKDILTSVGRYTFVNDHTWWPKVVPQFSTDGSIFLLGARTGSGHTNPETVWYSPDKGNYWSPLPQMPIGAIPLGSGLSESGWCVVNSSTLVMGDMSGLIYKTTNRGASWSEGALTGLGLEITSLVPSPVYSESGATGTDKCLLAGTYEEATGENEVWLSQDGAIKDLENIGDEIYVNPAWGDIEHTDLGGTVVNFDKQWATNRIIYAASAGWLDRWQLTGKAYQISRISYTDISVVRSIVDLADPSASTWQHLWDADNWNSAALTPLPIASMNSVDSVFRAVAPTDIQIGPDGTVYVVFYLWDSSYNNPGDNPTPNTPGYGRFTAGGVLRCLNGTLATPEFDLLNDGLGQWDGLYLCRVVHGSNRAISLTFDWKEWRFKLAFYDDTLSGAGPAPLSPLSGSDGCGVLVSNTSVNIQLSWQANTNTSLYQWQVSEDSAFTTPRSGSTSSLSVTVANLNPATEYYWRCRSIEPMASRWNAAQRFTTVIGGSGGAPKLGTPDNGGTISDATPLLTWSAVAGATNYRIQISTNSSFAASSIVVDKDLGDIQVYEPEAALENGTYYWHVKSINANNDTETPWSSLGSFTLDTSLNQAGTPPWVWVLITLSIILIISVVVLISKAERPQQTPPSATDSPTPPAAA